MYINNKLLSSPRVLGALGRVKDTSSFSIVLNKWWCCIHSARCPYLSWPYIHYFDGIQIRISVYNFTYVLNIITISIWEWGYNIYTYNMSPEVQEENISIVVGGNTGPQCVCESFQYFLGYICKKWPKQVTGEFGCRKEVWGEFRDDFFQHAHVGKLRFSAPWLEVLETGHFFIHILRSWGLLLFMM